MLLIKYLPLLPPTPAHVPVACRYFTYSSVALSAFWVVQGWSIGCTIAVM